MNCKHPPNSKLHNYQLSIKMTMFNRFANQFLSCFHRAYKQLAHYTVFSTSLFEGQPKIMYNINIFVIWQILFIIIWHLSFFVWYMKLFKRNVNEFIETWHFSNLYLYHILSTIFFLCITGYTLIFFCTAFFQHYYCCPSKRDQLRSKSSFEQHSHDHYAMSTSIAHHIVTIYY